MKPHLTNRPSIHHLYRRLRTGALLTLAAMTTSSYGHSEHPPVPIVNWDFEDPLEERLGLLDNLPERPVIEGVKGVAK